MAPLVAQPAQPRTSAAADASSRPVNGSSSSTRRGSWISARSSATRCRMPREKLATGSSARSAETRARERRSAAACACGCAVEAGEEREVLARGQLGIEKEVVAEDADAAAQRRAGGAAPMAAVANVAGARPQQRGQDREQRGLAGAVGSEQAENRPAACLKRNL